MQIKKALILIPLMALSMQSYGQNIPFVGDYVERSTANNPSSGIQAGEAFGLLLRHVMQYKGRIPDLDYSVLEEVKNNQVAFDVQLSEKMRNYASEPCTKFVSTTSAVDAADFRDSLIGLRQVYMDHFDNRMNETLDRLSPATQSLIRGELIPEIRRNVRSSTLDLPSLANDRPEVAKAVLKSACSSLENAGNAREPTVGPSESRAIGNGTAIFLQIK
jgi:hypothetical protein